MSKSAHESGWVEHATRLAPFEDVGVEGVDENLLAEFVCFGYSRGWFDPFSEKAAIESVKIVSVSLMEGENMEKMFMTYVDGGITAGPTRTSQSSAEFASQYS